MEQSAISRLIAVRGVLAQDGMLVYEDGEPKAHPLAGEYGRLMDQAEAAGLPISRCPTVAVPPHVVPAPR